MQHMPKEIWNKNILRQHLRYMHGEIKHRCNICDKEVRNCELNTHISINHAQGPRSPLKSEGAQGGYFFSCNFLLHFWAIWKNDPFSKFQKVGGLKPPPLPLLVRGP